MPSAHPEGGFKGSSLTAPSGGFAIELVKLAPRCCPPPSVVHVPGFIWSRAYDAQFALVVYKKVVLCQYPQCSFLTLPTSSVPVGRSQ